METEHCRFEVIPTPGHCPEHICLFEREQGWLFSGDLFIHERVRYLRTGEDVHTTMESLRRAQDRSLRLRSGQAPSVSSVLALNAVKGHCLYVSLDHVREQRPVDVVASRQVGSRILLRYDPLPEHDPRYARRRRRITGCLQPHYPFSLSREKMAKPLTEMVDAVLEAHRRNPVSSHRRQFRRRDRPTKREIAAFAIYFEI